MSGAGSGLRYELGHRLRPLSARPHLTRVWTWAALYAYWIPYDYVSVRVLEQSYQPSEAGGGISDGRPI